MNDRDLRGDDPQDWLNRARSDLTIANAEIPGAFLEDFCLHAQQAAEKALKGLLIALGVRSPYTHDIRVLLESIKEAGLQPPDEVLRASRLSLYASRTRYPGFESVTHDQYMVALAVASAVVEWVEQELESRSG